ncbi:MAG: hypothetical protein AAFR61_20195 [Bacteroidota bacterium]
MYNLALGEIFFTLSSGGYEFSPDKNLVVQFNMQADTFWVFDLTTIEADAFVQTYTHKLPQPNIWEQVQFLDNRSIRIDLDEPLTLQLNQLAWERKKSIDIGEYH